MTDTLTRLRRFTAAVLRTMNVRDMPACLDDEYDHQDNSVDTVLLNNLTDPDHQMDTMQCNQPTRLLDKIRNPVRTIEQKGDRIFDLIAIMKKLGSGMVGGEALVILNYGDVYPLVYRDLKNQSAAPMFCSIDELNDLTGPELNLLYCYGVTYRIVLYDMDG